MWCRLLAVSLLCILVVSSVVSAEPTGLLADFLVAPDGERYRINDFNSPLGNNQLIVYTPAFGPSTATVNAMVEVVVVEGVVEEVLPIGHTNTPIPHDGYVISGHGTAATWLRLHVRPGQPVALLRDRLVADTVSASHPVHQIGPHVTRGANQLVIFTPGRERTGTNPWGIEAVVQEGVIVSVGGNDNSIPANGFILSAHGTARDWLAENARVGATVTIDNEYVTLAFDSRSVARQAVAYLDIAEGRMQEAEEQGIPLAFDHIAAHKDEAEKLLAMAERLQTDGEQEQAMRAAARAVGAAQRAAFAALPSSPVGIRGVWYRPVEITPEHVIATLDRLARSGVNTLFLETFYRGRTVYPSEIVNQHTEFRRWDLLDVWIREGQRRGIDVHLWLHVFRFDEYPSGTLLGSRPEWLASRPGSSVPQEYQANSASADPAHPEVRAFVLALIEEMLTRYAPAGIHLDYIRYPKSNLQPGSFAIADFSRELFAQEHGVDPLHLVNRRGSPEWQAWEMWQEEQITSFVADVHDLVRRLAPDTILSAAVVGEIGEARSVTRQNWVAWAEQGYVDLLLPMLYNPDAAWVGRAVARAVEQTGGRTLLSAGIGVYLDFSPELLVEQVWSAESAGSLGATHFALVHMRGDHFAALTEGLYSHPTVPPYRTAEAFASLGTALLESLPEADDRNELHTVAHALIAHGSKGQEELAQLLSFLEQAIATAREMSETVTAWQARLLHQAHQVAAAALHRLHPRSVL